MTKFNQLSQAQKDEVTTRYRLTHAISEIVVDKHLQPFVLGVHGYKFAGVINTDNLICGGFHSTNVR